MPRIMSRISDCVRDATFTLEDKIHSSQALQKYTPTLLTRAQAWNTVRALRKTKPKHFRKEERPKHTMHRSEITHQVFLSAFPGSD